MPVFRSRKTGIVFPVLRTHVKMLNCRISTALIYTNITISWLLFLFRCDKSLFFPLNIIHTQSLFIFICACSHFVVDFQFIILYWFVDMCNCFVDSRLNKIVCLWTHLLIFIILLICLIRNMLYPVGSLWNYLILNLDNVNY